MPKPLGRRMAVRSALGVATALLLGPVPLAAETRLLAEIPIEVERNKTILPVTVGGSGPLRVILDTGMARDGLLLFDATRVDRERLGPVEEHRVRGAGSGGSALALSAEAASFSVGPLEIENQRVTLMTGEAFREFPTDGVIGHSLLGHYAVEVDYDRKRILLYEASSFVPEAGWESLEIEFKENRIPWTRVLVATGDEAPVQLSTYVDSASGEAVELLERETNRFTPPAETREIYVGRGLSGDIHGREGRVSKLRLGPFELHDVTVVVTPAEVRSKQVGADAILGNDALRRFNLIFDYAHRRIHLRPNRSFTEPFRFPPRNPAPADR